MWLFRFVCISQKEQLFIRFFLNRFPSPNSISSMKDSFGKTEQKEIRINRYLKFYTLLNNIYYFKQSHMQKVKTMMKN